MSSTTAVLDTCQARNDSGSLTPNFPGLVTGKGIGEMIDPTTEDNWLSRNFNSRPYVREGDTFETYYPAYRYGAEAESKFGKDDFDTIEEKLETGWNETGDAEVMPWNHVRGAVRDSYQRTAEIRRARQCP
jgi:hypothetical protein